MEEPSTIESGLGPFEGGILYARFLRSIETRQKSIESALLILFNNPLPLNARYLRILKTSTRNKRLEVDRAYEICRRLNSKYYGKNQELLTRESKNLDKKLDEFYESYEKMDKILQTQN